MNRKGPIAILLLLCFSVVLIHSMVPHHHHHGVVAESSASCCDEQHSSQNRHSTQNHPSPHSPHSSQSSRGHHDLNDPLNHFNHHIHHNPQDQCSCDAHPRHCDAFNEITFFKSSSSRIDAPPVVNSLFLTAPCSDVLQLADQSTDPGYFVPRTIQHTTCPGGRTTSLRGPPRTA